MHGAGVHVKTRFVRCLREVCGLSITDSGLGRCLEFDRHWRVKTEKINFRYEGIRPSTSRRIFKLSRYWKKHLPSEMPKHCCGRNCRLLEAPIYLKPRILTYAKIEIARSVPWAFQWPPQPWFEVLKQRSEAFEYLDQKRRRCSKMVPTSFIHRGFSSSLRRCEDERKRPFHSRSLSHSGDWSFAGIFETAAHILSTKRWFKST